MKYQSQIHGPYRRDHHIPYPIFAIMVIVSIILGIATIALSVTSNELDRQVKERDLEILDLQIQKLELEETIYELKKEPYTDEEKLETLSVVSRGKMAVVTAYCLTGDMANGEQVHDGAVANNDLPFGTQVRIDGKQYTVKDRIGHGTEWDVWMSECGNAIKHGRKTLSVEIL